MEFVKLLRTVVVASETRNILLRNYVGHKLATFNTVPFTLLHLLLIQ